MSVRKSKHVGLWLLGCLALGFLVACGGGGSYDAPSSSTTPSWHADYNEADDVGILLDAATVADWIDNGFKTDDGKSVVIFDIVGAADGVDRIIGSVSKAEIESYTNRESRNEGPISSSGKTSDSMIPSGATIDAIMQDLGLTHDTVLVLTGATSLTSSNLRTWWMLKYWGISDKYLKVLDGGVAALKAEDPTLVDTTTPFVDPADSTFCVQDLPSLNLDVRVSTRQVIDAVSNGTAVILDARSPGSGYGYTGRIKGAISVSEREMAGLDGNFYKTAEEYAANILDNVTEISSTSNIITHCWSGGGCQTVTFILKGILGYKNVAVYDGSFSAWSMHHGWAAAEDAVIDGGTFSWAGDGFAYDNESNTLDSEDIVRGGLLTSAAYPSDPLFDSWDTMRFTEGMSFVWSGAASTDFTVDFNYTGTGNEIAEEDYSYWAPEEESVDGDDDSTTEVDDGGC